VKYLAWLGLGSPRRLHNSVGLETKARNREVSSLASNERSLP
jgi:hypothetical protein